MERFFLGFLLAAIVAIVVFVGVFPEKAEGLLESANPNKNTISIEMELPNGESGDARIELPELN